MTWAPTSLPPLTAPVWGRQPEETPQAYDAFLAWLCGGTHVRDWAAAARTAGMTIELVRTLSQRWVWEVRANEWIRSARRLAFEAMAPLRDELTAMQAVRIRAHRAALELEALELEKTLAKAKGIRPEAEAGLPTTLDPRELAALRRVNVVAADSFRREAAGLPPEGTGSDEVPDWTRLPPDKLEEYRKLREQARNGSSGH